MQIFALETVLPVFQNKKNCGDVNVDIESEKIKRIEKTSLMNSLISCTNYDLNEIKKLDDWTDIEAIGIDLKYNPVNLSIEINIPIENEAKSDFSLNDDISPRIKAQALKPAPISAAINYRFEKEWADSLLGDDQQNLYLDTFINIKGVVLESEINHSKSDSSQDGWFRGDTRLVKDIQNKDIRLQAGDIYPESFGFMQGRPIGGISAATDFTLNPYTLPFPQGRGSFVLRSRSNVKTFVNNVLIKNEVLPAGNYDLRDIPLINGLNKVIVETTDESGQKKIFQFNLPTSSELLNKDKWRFSISSGVPFRDINLKRDYSDSNLILTSGFAQYGLTKSLTLGGYSQQQSDFYLLGSEIGLATKLGNFFIGAASSKDNQANGQAAQLSWQLQSIGAGLFNTYSFILRHQYLGQGFSTSNNSILNRIEHRTQASITLPVEQRMTLSLGASLGVPRDNQNSKAIGYDTTINLRLVRNLNLNLFLSRTKDELKNRNDTAYMFLTWTFDGTGDLVNGFHDFESNTSRLSLVKDNMNRLYKPRITANIDKNDNSKAAEIDAFVPMPFADIGTNIETSRSKLYNKNLHRGSVRIASALTFAKHDKEFAFGVSRPIPNSFVLFTTDQNLKDQKLALRSTSPFNESSTGPLGQITYNNLLPYQYREIQLDPSQLDDGVALEQERYVVYPTYKSAHLINIKDKGTLVLKGQIIKPNGQTAKLIVGDINGEMFFTDRSGYFYVQSVQDKEAIISLRGFKDKFTINLESNERGIKDIGQLKLLENE